MRLKITFLALALTITGCGGRAANPVMVSQYGDEKMSCAAMELEMHQAQSSIQRLVPQTDKTGKNVALGVTGFFLIVPLFFMDLSQAEQIEVEALRQRYNRLAVLATDRKCGDVEQIPAFDAPKEDQKKS